LVRDKLQINKNEKSLLQMDITLFEGKSKDKMTKLMYVNTLDMSFTDEIKGAERFYYSLKPNYKAEGQFFVSDIIEVSGPDIKNNKNRKR
jgi:hypothetical protein